MRAVLLGFLLLLGLAGAAPAQTQSPAAVNGCIYYSSLPTLANGQRNSFLCDVNGKLLTTSSGGGGGGITIGSAVTGCGTIGGLIYNAASNLVACTSGWTTDGTTALTGAASTTLAIGGAAIGANALAVGGNAVFSGSVLGFSFTSQSNYNVTATGYYGHLGRSRIYSPVDGNFQLANNANSNFGLLQFGGTTSSFPALKVSGATLQVRLSDDSGASSLSASTLTTATGYTVGTLPAGATGMRSYVTDQLTACAVTGAALTGGGAVVCPVFYNGSAWVGG